MAILKHHTYGKSDVRLVKVVRDGAQHEIVELTADIALEADVSETYLSGDNSKVIPTDTIKNTVYALAKQIKFDSIEAFGLAYTAHFLEKFEHVGRATIMIEERPWKRMLIDGERHTHAFMGASREVRTVTVNRGRDGVTVTSGMANLPILKTTGSGFSDFLRDEFTTLGDAADRLIGTNLTARWTYKQADGVSFNEHRKAIRQALLETFAKHDGSLSVQQTLYLMGEHGLAVCADVDEMYLSMPNVHRLLVDLTPFGMDNEDEIYVPTDEPAGMIEATIGRD